MNFYVTGGSLRSDAPCYVERQADTELLALLLEGEFCYVLTARQMGKSSLMVRAATRLRESGIQVAALDLTAIGGQNVSPEQWYHGLLDTLGQELDLEDELEEFWRAHLHLGPLHRLMQAVRHVVLARLESSGQAPESPTGRRAGLVIFVDELDFVRSLPFPTDEFFAAIRECYNRRNFDPAYRRLTFCLLGVASPSDLIRDTRTTPFNIGRRIELNDFTDVEAGPLANGLRRQSATAAASDAGALLTRILYWTHGHPYLTQRLCHSLSLRPDPPDLQHVDEICQDLFLSHRAKERDDNLVFVRERLLRNEAESVPVLRLYREVLDRGRPVLDVEANPRVTLLRLSGVVRSEAGRLVVRNRIYKKAFGQDWIDSHLPDAELRRERDAYVRGLVRATAVATAVLAVMAALTVLALQSRSQAKQATWTALRQQARLQRTSGLAGQQFGALESIREAARIKMTPELRDEALACFIRPDIGQLQPGAGPQAGSLVVVWSDDGQSYAAVTTNGDVALRNVADQKDAVRWPSRMQAPQQLWLGPAREFLAIAGSEDGQAILAVRRCDSGALLFAITNATLKLAVDFSPDGRRVAVGDESGTVRIFSLSGADPPVKLKLEEPCSVLSFNPDGNRLAAASSARLTIGIYEPASGKPIQTLYAPSPPIGLAWNPRGDLLAATATDARVRLWEINGGEFAQQELAKQPDRLTALAFSHSGAVLATTSADQRLRLWDLSGRLLLTAPAPAEMRQLRFSPDDHQLIFENDRGGLQRADVALGQACRTFFEPEAESLNAVAIHSGGRLLAAAHLNGVTFWDAATAARLGRMNVGSTKALCFHPVSGELVDAEFRGTYAFAVHSKHQRAQDLLTLAPKQNFYFPPGAVAVDVAGASRVVAVAYDDRVRLAEGTDAADATLGEFIGTPGFKSLAVSPNGQQIVAGNWNTDELWVWDRTSSAKPRRLPVGAAYARFSSDGHWLALGTLKSIALLDTRSWEAAWHLPRPGGATRPAAVAFATNGSILAVAWTDKAVRLLRVTGEVAANLDLPVEDTLTALALSPDGSQLVCGTQAHSAVLWDLQALGQKFNQVGLGFEADLSLMPPGSNAPPAASRPVSEASGDRSAAARLQLQIGALDRLGFSSVKQILQLRREMAHLTALIGESPANQHYHRYRAEKYQQLGEYGQAIADYRRWIELDQQAGTNRAAADKAWPLRDLALIYLEGPKPYLDYAKAAALLREALALDAENADNHFRYGVACYRLRRYEDAAPHLEAARRSWEKGGTKLTAVLFYQAMCSAQAAQSAAATQFLDLARQAYNQTDLPDRASQSGALSDLFWEAERVVTGPGVGG
jgi:WD40 repeat protein